MDYLPISTNQHALVTEPFISPALFEEYVNSSSFAVVDEWTLSLAMGADLATKMENHYKTFIVSGRPFFIFDTSHFCLDRKRLRRYCWWVQIMHQSAIWITFFFRSCGFKLGSNSHRVLGNRNYQRWTFPHRYFLDVLPQSVSHSISLTSSSNGRRSLYLYWLHLRQYPMGAEIRHPYLSRSSRTTWKPKWLGECPESWVLLYLTAPSDLFTQNHSGKSTQFFTWFH